MSDIVSKSEQIDFLVFKKFPNVENVESAYRRPQPIKPIDSRDNSRSDRIFAELEMRYEIIQDYRKELAIKSREEIGVLFAQEKAKSEEEKRSKAELVEKKYLYNQPHANADFEFWSKAKHWTLDEAIALSFGKEPSVVNYDLIATYLRNPSSFVIQYTKIRDLAFRALQWQELFDPVLPGIFIAWARRLDIDFPKELEEKVIARGGNIGDWKTAYDALEKNHNTLKEEYERYSAGAMEELIKRGNEIRDLKGINGLLEARLLELGDSNKSPSKEKGLNPKVRDSLLKLVIPMHQKAQFPNK